MLLFVLCISKLLYGDILNLKFDYWYLEKVSFFSVHDIYSICNDYPEGKKKTIL